MYFRLNFLIEKRLIYKKIFGLRPGPRPRWPGAYIRLCVLRPTVGVGQLVRFVQSSFSENLIVNL
jgi:hypothetical protein